MPGPLNGVRVLDLTGDLSGLSDESSIPDLEQN